VRATPRPLRHSLKLLARHVAENLVVDAGDERSGARELPRALQPPLGHAPLDDLNQPGAQVMGDPEELKSALSNLIDNAIKYSHDRLHVVVSVRPGEKGRYAVTVEDRGIGISPPELKRIFRRFYRVPGSITIRVKGTGLGLFIVR